MTVQPSQSAQEPLEPLIESSRGPTYNGGGCPCSACSWLLKVYAILALLAILLAPIICLVAAFLPGGLGLGTLLAIAIGVPILCIVTLLWPVCLYDPDAYDNVGMTQFTLNGNTMTYENYYSKLVDFANAATTKTWRKDLGKWFEDFTTTDKMVGTWGCGTKMYYSFATCKEKLQQMNSKISADTLKRESQLALGFFNNVSWREAGRFALGARKDDHAFCRPLLAEMFSAKSNPGWTPASLRSEFKNLFAHITTLDHNNRNGHRGANDPFFPSKTKSILTQWTLKVLHRVGLGMDLTDAEAEELSAMQTVGLLTAGATSTICSIFLFYAFFTKPTLLARAKYIEKYRPFIQKRWPTKEWTVAKLDLMGSMFLDAMLFAGGRSVPLSMDLVLGYILTRNKPESCVGVDFKKEENIRSLLMEAMRLHPVVTTVPYWVKGDDTSTGQGTWEHEAVWIDRALADPSVFPEPDAFLLNRPGQGSTDESSTSNSIAWAEFALVDGKNDHPHSHGCPAKDLSINMIVAFVQEYHAAGPWRVVDDNIHFDYYGTIEGFKCTKMV